MSEPGPSSNPIPTSRLSQSQPPRKKLRPNSSAPPSALATATQSYALNRLFATHTDTEITLPPSSSSTPKTLPPPPEIMPNVQGSSAGAGSGEFHVYKAARRREMERVKGMEEEVRKEEEAKEWEKQREERENKEMGKREKNRRQREKAKERKGKGGGEREGKGDMEMADGKEGKNGVGERKKGIKVGLAGVKGGNGAVGEKDEEDGEDTAVPVADDDEPGIVIHDDD